LTRLDGTDELCLVRYALVILVTVWLVAVSRTAHADELTTTDVNIVTGIDVSGSIEARETQIQIDGMALAIRSPEVMRAIRQGKRGRVGFAVFLWANGNYPVFASWQLISSPEEAAAVSDAIATLIPAILDAKSTIKLGELTDLSGAMAYGAEMLRTAPYAADHKILNILGNGIDNVGESPKWVRDKVVAQGIMINAVVIGHDRGVQSYFRTEVIGGPAAFVLTAREPEALVKVLERKFVTEIVLNAQQPGVTGPQ
jgi:Ca-activated chloride channel homolog